MEENTVIESDIEDNIINEEDKESNIPLSDDDVFKMDYESFNEIFKNKDYSKKIIDDNDLNDEKDDSNNFNESNEENENNEEEVSNNVDKNNESDEKNELDYKEIYDSIFKEFDSNGTKIKPKDANEVNRLIKMGMNYTSLEEKLQEQLQITESLKEAKIDTNSLNFLIDIHKGNKDAIKKLIEDKNIDINELELEDKQYTPSNNIQSKEEAKFNTYLNTLDSKTYEKIQNIFNYWDNESKQALSNNLELMQGLAQEIELGRFDEIEGSIKRKKILGEISNVNNLSAYINTVSELYPVNRDININNNKTVEIESNNSNNILNKNKAKRSPAKTVDTQTIEKLNNPEDLLTMPYEDFLKYKKTIR